MTAPNPLLVGILFKINQSRRLRVMNEDNITIKVHFLRIFFSRLTKGLEILFGYSFMPIMKGIVEFFRNAEKFIVPLNNVPASVDAQLLHERHHPAQNFRNAAADKGRVNILNYLAGKLASYQPEFVDSAFADDSLILVDAYLMRFSINRISADLSPSRV